MRMKMTRFILPGNHYSLKNVPDVAEICEILQQFKITYFCYSRFFNDGSAYVLINHGESLEHHCRQQYPVCPPISTEYRGKKFHYLPYLDQITGKEPKAVGHVFQDYRQIFNFSYPLYFIESTIDYIDLYAYATSADNIDALNFYLNNLDVFEKFKFYFKDKADKLIERSNINRIVFPKHMYSAVQESREKSQYPKRKEKLLNQLEPKKYLLNKNGINFKVTKRELEVLKNLALGCTLKETAESLKISPRTTEEYFNNLKSKFCLNRKSELLKFMVEFDLI